MGAGLIPLAARALLQHARLAPPGIDALEQLQRHDNEDIYTRAVGILERYLGALDEEEDASVGQLQTVFRLDGQQELPAAGPINFGFHPS